LPQVRSLRQQPKKLRQRVCRRFAHGKPVRQIRTAKSRYLPSFSRRAHGNIFAESFSGTTANI
jgi:hypothetical protein